jgi:acyl carrier protein
MNAQIMGLDGVELIMAFEEEFGVYIRDADAERFETPRGVIDWLWHRLDPSFAGSCPTQRGFHEVRRALMAVAGVTRAEVRLETRLDELLPPSRRQKVWDALIAEPFALPVAPLGCPSMLRWAILGSGVFAGILLAVAIAKIWGGAAGFWLGCFGALAVCYFGAWVLHPFCICLPQGVHTIRDLAMSFTSSRAEKFVGSEPAITREKIAAEVRRLVIEQLGIDPAEYREDASFVKDFGVD